MDYASSSKTRRIKKKQVIEWKYWMAISYLAHWSCALMERGCKKGRIGISDGLLGI